MLIIILFLIYCICKYLYNTFYYFIINIEDHKGNTNLHMSLRFNKKFLSKYLINYYNRYNEIVNFNLDRPIHIACRYSREEEVKDLLKNNVNINIKNNLGETPLMIACIMNNLKIVKLLIEHGADINILSYKNKNLLQLVYSIKNTFEDNTELFMYLLNNNSINHKDISGNTISHYVIRNLDLKYFEILEKYNLDYNITNNYNRNLLFELIIGYKELTLDIFINYKDIYSELFNKLFDKIIDKINLFTRDNYRKLAHNYCSDKNIQNKIIDKIAEKIENILLNNNIIIPIDLVKNIINYL